MHNKKWGIKMMNEGKYNWPTKGHSRRQTSYPRPVGKTKSFGGEEISERRNKFPTKAHSSSQSAYPKSKISKTQTFGGVKFESKQKISERKYKWPTKAHSGSQSAFPRSKPKTQTFGGVKFEGKFEENDVMSEITKSVVGDNEGSDLITILNELRSGEIVSYLQYELFGITVPSLNMQGLEDLFEEHEESEREHAKQLAQRIHELGGTPVFELSQVEQLSPYKIQEVHSATEMVQVLKEQEEIAIQSYRDAIKHFENHDPATRRLLEDILAEEEEHATDMRSMLETTE